MFTSIKWNPALLLAGTILCFVISGCHYLDDGHDSDQSVEIEITNAALPQEILTSQTASDGCDATIEDGSYRLGSGDVLKIQVFGEQDLSGDFTIDERGMITLPLINDIAIAGCRVVDVKNKVYAQYADGYLVEPNISVEVEQFRPFYIIGEVREPGRYDFAVGMNVYKAAALAGGFTYRANKRKIEIRRNDYTGQKIIKTKVSDANIEPGDIIVIKERLF